MPSGMPMTMLAASDRKTSARCSSVSRPKSGPKSLCQKPPGEVAVRGLRRSAGVLRGRVAGAACRRRNPRRSTRSPCRRVPPPRSCVRIDASSIVALEVSAAPPTFAGRRCGKVGAVEQHGVVAREVVAIVGEHRRARTCRSWRRSSRCRSRRPAAARSLRTQGRGRGRAACRTAGRTAAFSPGQPSARPMNSCDSPSRSSGCALEVGQARDALRARIVAADRQRIGVVEAERHGDREAHAARAARSARQAAAPRRASGFPWRSCPCIRDRRRCCRT